MRKRVRQHCMCSRQEGLLVRYLPPHDACLQAGPGLRAQRRYQQRLFTGYIAQGVEEMRVSRLPYSGLAPSGFDSTNRSQIEQNDFTMRTADCMQRAYDNRSVGGMLGCWSRAGSYDDFMKSADMAGACPFHYNHWSCDGGRGGGRDGPRAPRCRCKVSLDLINGYAYRPVPEKCHLFHFNNNKVRCAVRCCVRPLFLLLPCIVVAHPPCAIPVTVIVMVFVSAVPVSVPTHRSEP